MAKERFYSLDVFRGATIALMILVNDPGSWAHIFGPFKHAEWHGLTPTDWVYPFFLFAVGNAFAFVMPRLRAGEPSRFWKKIIKRSILIFLIGLFLSWMPFVRWEDGSLVFKSWTWTDADGVIHGVRILGVLQRIAIAYLLASIIVYFFKIKGSFYIACAILLGYWLLTWGMNPSDPYSFEGWFGTNIDKLILGEPHMWHGEVRNGHPVAFDPEGFMSSFGPIAQIIFGYICGHYIIKKGKTQQMVNGVFVAGAVCMFIGYMWSWAFPINKKIWTSSFVVMTSGIAMTILGVMTYWMELKEKKGWLAHFFNVFGKNPLFIFFLSGFIPITLSLIHIPNGVGKGGDQIYTSPLPWFYENICKPVFPDNLKLGSLLYAIIFVIFMWVIAYWLDRKKIYIKV